MANDRQYGNQYGRQNSADAQEIGPLPKIINPKRRKIAEKSLERFLKLYFPWAFSLKWSPDHLRNIEKIQNAVIDGGLFALAMPRGSGKTTISERAALWAILTGRRKFVTLVAATEKNAEQILKSQMTELQYNDLLLEDFPEACYPIRKLENEARRCKGQKCMGSPTNIVWTACQLVLPSLPKLIAGPCDGAIVSVCGITGAIRGQKHTTRKGEILRPSFVLIDDPQTRESAESESQCQTREAIIAGDVLGMSGPGQKISAVMPCTVIRKGDVADSLLNRKKHPDWNGSRTKMVNSFPKNQKAIDQYAEFRAQALYEERGLKSVNAYWKKHRKELEEGASVAWPERKLADEISAIQHAVNLMLRDRGAFFAEYQNDPIEEKREDELTLTADQICAKLSGIPRGILTVDQGSVTAFIDVQKHALYWCVCGWGENFSGNVIDYGIFPEQGRNYFNYSDLSVTLADAFPGKSEEGAIFAALEVVTNALCSREWKRDDQTVSKLSRLLIDEGYQTDIVHQFCRSSPFAAVVMPSKGFGVKAGNKPMNEYQKRPGEKAGLNWRITTAEGRAQRYVMVDTNFWKSFLFARLAVSRGTPGCLSLFGEVPIRHRLFADHLKSEYSVKTFGRGRDVTEWAQKPGKPDNHWLDCLVGCCVGASVQGIGLLARGAGIGTGKRVSFSKMQANRKSGSAK
jgi:hypothetical protein